MIPYSLSNPWLASVPHDGSDLYVSNLYPRLGEKVRLRLRVSAEAPIRHVYLRTFPDGEQAIHPMTRSTVEPPVAWCQSVEYASMTSLSQDFRRQLEHEHGGPIHELTEVNAAELISYLCVFLGLSDHNRRKVLGARAATHLDQTLTERVRATLKH